jgi:hypothetical protein
MTATLAGNTQQTERLGPPGRAHAVVRQLGVRTEQRTEIEDAKQDVYPGTVLDVISQRQDSDNHVEA